MLNFSFCEEVKAEMTLEIKRALIKLQGLAVLGPVDDSGTLERIHGMLYREFIITFMSTLTVDQFPIYFQDGLLYDVAGKELLDEKVTDEVACELFEKACALNVAGAIVDFDIQEVTDFLNGYEYYDPDVEETQADVLAENMERIEGQDFWCECDSIDWGD